MINDMPTASAPNPAHQASATPAAAAATASTAATASHPIRTPSKRLRARTRELLPGLLICLAAAAAAYGVGKLLPGLSPMLIAILLGVIAANVGVLPASAAPGIAFSAKKLLRLGIVFLGLQLVLGDIIALGAPMILVVIAVVTGGIFGTIWLGKMLRVPEHLTLLIACGFSICGAAAVAGAAGVTDPDEKHEQDTVTAVALVVIFGTLMIPLVPLIAPLLGLTHDESGMWAGASTHEIAQAVAIGGILGGSALTLAVIVKLARVLLLAPVMAVLSLRVRREASRAALSPAAAASQPKLPPIVPLFILGFLAMVLLRSFVPLPDAVLASGQMLQTVLLAAAMFGLGCGVKIKSLMQVGLRPFALAALSTLLVAGIAFAGILLAR